MTGFLGRPGQGRTFTGRQRVRLGDTFSNGTLRPDAAVRYLQDVATDDWDDTGISTGALWVVRRTSLRLVSGGRWPTLGEYVDLTTWCSGSGAAWAERRTDLEVEGKVLVEAVALWVPLDPSMRPKRIDDAFRAVYGEAANGRKIPGRVESPVVPDDATREPWPLRRVDLDVAGHVNNAASWTALVEVAGEGVGEATLIHHGPVEIFAPVELARTPGGLWLLQDGVVKVSARYR